MAGKLPPRELAVVIQDVVPLDYEEIPLAFRMSDPVPIPAGTICQVLKRDNNGICATRALIYYCDEVTVNLETGWVPILALRPYDPEKDAPEEEANKTKPEELPPSGRCMP